MKVWTNTTASGRYLGVCSVVIAATAEEAAALLNAELAHRGLTQKRGPVKASEMILLQTHREHVRILFDGDY